MSAEKLESFLAQLYVDEQACRRFLSNPRGEAENAGLTQQDCAALENIDLVGLELAAGSFAKKRRAQTNQQTSSLLSRWLRRT